MTAKLWPAALLPASKVNFYEDIPSASGGVSIGGGEQVVMSSAGRWRAALSFPVNRRRMAAPGHGRDQILVARALASWMKGRTNAIQIGPFDCSNAPLALDGSTLQFGGPDPYKPVDIYQVADPFGAPISTAGGFLSGIPFSDGALFSDGSGFSQPRVPVVLADDADAGAMGATVTMLMGTQTPRAGQYFGFGFSELYRIDSVDALGSDQYALTFWPTLRNTHLVGEDVNFDDPRCEMRKAKDDSGQLDFAPGYSAVMALELVENV